MEDFVRQSLLFDFYGDLLTEHQKLVYGSFVQENLSLSEIAQDSHISRQGVHDLIRRCRNSLEEYESKLHLVDRFLKIREKVSAISQSQSLEEAKNISEEIMELL
ncbi:MAG: DNA-binding protein [Lachnospiraceae bacterium]|nr:DNA-binding protein [Lachnospiraceae bacterium]